MYYTHIIHELDIQYTCIIYTLYIYYTCIIHTYIYYNTTHYDICIQALCELRK